MALLEGLLVGLVALLVLASVLPLLHVPWWWVRSFDFPRLQIAALLAGVTAALATLALARATLDGVAGVAATLGVAALLYQLWRIWPYTRLAPVQVLPASVEAADRRLRLVVSNVEMQNREGARWLDVIRAADADVIAAIEADAWWAETASGLVDTHPHAVEVPQDDTYGMVVRSRLPILAHEVRHLVEPEVPSLWLTVALADGSPVRLVFVHPRPPRPDTRQDSALRDAELVRVAREVERETGPLVVAGDLNDVAWSDTTTLFQAVSRLLDPRVGRGMFSTFDARRAWLRYPLDHVFHSRHFALVDLALLDRVGSDHFPIGITLALDPRRAPQQAPPTPDAADRAEAAEHVAEAADQLAHETPEDKRERVEEDV